jgi:tetratricopeptide (TPR) repeat protein
MLTRLSIVALTSLIATGAWSAPRAPQLCAFTSVENATIEEFISVIESEPACGLPWPALRKVAADPANVERLRAAYAKIASLRADRAEAVREQLLIVEAAAGRPEAMLAYYDGNVASHPADPTLPNASCWVRAMSGIDVDHALSFCDRAVAAGRPPYSLVNRGMVNLLLGRNDAALQDFDEALRNRKFRKHPFYAQALYGRGYARLQSGDGRGAKDLRRAIGLNESVAASFRSAGLRS